MAIKALTVTLLAALLAVCQTTDEKADEKAEKRLQVAAVAQGQAAAQPPKLVLPDACTAKVDCVTDSDEPWVIHNWRWKVSADNRDQKADDCGAYEVDYNRRLEATYGGAR